MKKVYFEKIDNRNIFCAENIVKDSKKILIMCHGFRGESSGNSRIFVRLENLLQKENISTLRFDQYGCGNSDGDFIESEFDNWVHTIGYFIKKYQEEGFEVSVLGWSMGATSAGVAASKIANIKKLFLLMPDPVVECDIDEEEIAEEKGQKYYGKFWVQAYQANLVNCLKDYDGYMYVVYGDSDEVISQESREAVIGAIKESWGESDLLQEQGHGNWRYEVVERVMRKVVEIELADINKVTDRK